ncbi:MAG: tetratricopeptide repeat protein [Thermoflexales bacterium]|nr:tetratricopeptide repeat protein [Thermoflexales bacterium]
MDGTGLFHQAMALIKSGQKAQARRLLVQLTLEQPDHELAWLWLSDLLEQPEQRRYCLQRVLQANPDNQLAQHGLGVMNRQAQPSAPQQSSTPDNNHHAQEHNTAVARPELATPSLAEQSGQAQESTVTQASHPPTPLIYRIRPRRLVAIAGLAALFSAVMFILWNVLQRAAVMPAQVPTQAVYLVPPPPPPTATPSPTRPPATPKATPTPLLVLAPLGNGAPVLPEFAALVQLTLTPTPRGDYTPHPRNGAYERGVQAYLAGDYTAALDYFERALVWDVQETCCGASKPDELMTALNQEMADVHYYHGLALAAAGRCQEAVRSFDMALERRDGFAAALAERGTCFDALGEPAKAWSDYTAATRMDRQLITPYLGRAERYAQDGQIQRAREEYDRALKLQPGHVELLYRRALLSHAAGHHTRAMDDLDKALGINPKLAKAYVLRGQIQAELLRYPDALHDLSVALALAATEADTWYQRGKVYQQLGESGRALSDFDNALALEPDLAGALVGRGDSYFERGELTLARINYNNALVCDPHLAEAAIGLGRVMLALESYDQAIENLYKALAARPGDEDALMYLGQALVLARRYAEAVSTLNQAIRAVTPAPKQAVMYEWRGRALHGLGRFSDAIKDFSLAIARYPTAERFYYRALAYQAAGNRTMARKDLERSLEGNQLGPALREEALLMLEKED